MFKDHGISLNHIESRPSRNYEWEHEFLVEFKTPSAGSIEDVKKDLGAIAKTVQVIGEVPEDTKSKGTQKECLHLFCILISGSALVPPKDV